MKIFLAGGTGVVGTRALPALVAAGHHVTAIARTPAKADLVRSLGGEAVTVDLFDPDALAAAAVGHDAVVNLATAIPNVTKAARAKAWETNERIRTEGSRNLVDAALAVGATHVVQESIGFPYADRGAEWIDEDWTVTHDGVFAGAAHAEASARRFAEQGGTGIVLRYGQFYAPEADHTVTFNKALRRRVNPFVGPPDAYVSFIHAEDAGSAVAAALTAPSGTYNVVDDEPMTREEVGRAIAERLGVKPPHALPQAVQKAGPSMAKRLMRSQRLANGRFKAATGWAPAHPSIRGSWPA